MAAQGGGLLHTNMTYGRRKRRREETADVPRRILGYRLLPKTRKTREKKLPVIDEDS